MWPSFQQNIPEVPICKEEKVILTESYGGSGLKSSGPPWDGGAAGKGGASWQKQVAE